MQLLRLRILFLTFSLASMVSCRSNRVPSQPPLPASSSPLNSTVDASPRSPAPAVTITFRHPLPQANDLYGISGLAEDEWWAVGAMGTIVHYRQGDWAVQTGLSPYALYAIQALTAKTLWAVGENGLALHFNGTSWKAIPTGTNKDLHAVWGTGPNDVWAVGKRGTLLHFDGNHWKPFLETLMVDWLGIWGTSSNHVWAVSKQGTVAHWDGLLWKEINVRAELCAIGGTSEKDIWAIGPNAAFSWNGQKWQKSPQTLSGCSLAASPDHLWLVHPKGDVYFHKNQGWRRWPQPELEVHANAVWSPNKQAAWAVGEHGIVYRFGEEGWNRVPRFGRSNKQTNNFLYGMWGTSPNNLWAIGENLLHFDGHRWQTQRLGIRWSGVVWRALWGTSEGRVWMVGNQGNIAWSKGEDWYPVPSVTDTNLTAIWGTDAGNIWVVGDQGTILHMEGTRFHLVASEAHAHLQSIWGSSAKDIWAVGDHGVVLHFDGTAWKIVPLDIPHNLRVVFGTSANDIWIAGEGGFLLHFDGNHWKRSELPQNSQRTALNAVWGSAPSNLWAVGTQDLRQGALLFHFNGVQWRPVPIGVQPWLLTLFGFSASTFWAAGAEGTIVQITPTVLSGLSSGDLR